MESKGKCRLCQKSISRRAMTRHLKTCMKKRKSDEDKNNNQASFLIKAHAGPFFVYFEANTELTLEDVDQFLRDLWLECCGHLSDFIINSVRYSRYPEPVSNEKNMKIKLKQVLKPALKFGHEYDFGTTTELELECLSKINRAQREINILARNDMPNFKCQKCGESATEVCTRCIWDSEGFFCSKCAKTHKCEGEYFLPLVNSPRSGLCGFTGEDCPLLNK